MNNLKKILTIIISITILGLLFYKIGIEKTYQNFLEVPISFYFIIISIILIDLTLTAINLKILLIPLKENIKFKKLYIAYLRSWAVGLLIPGKVGESSLVYFLKNDIEPNKTLSIFLLDKLITFLVLGLFASIGIFFFFGIQKAILTLASIILILIISLLLIKSKTIRNIIIKILRNKASIFKGFNSTFQEYIKNNKKYLFIDFIITIIQWSTAIIPGYIFIKYYFEQNVSFFQVLSISSIGTLSGLIPISINGIGVRESINIILFNQLGVDSSVVLLCCSLGIVIGLLMGSVFLLSFLLKKSPKKESKIYIKRSL